MLARTELSAKELGINEYQRQALITVRNALEREELRHVNHIPARYRFGGANADVFYMPCGPTCIAGHAWRLCGQSFPAENATGLYDLFMGYSKCAPSPTQAQAAQAISNYLATGHPLWCDVK